MLTERQIPTLHDLEQLTSELYDVYNRSCSGDASDLSTSERQYVHTLEHAIVTTLTHATLASSTALDQRDALPHHQQQQKHEHDALPLNDVRVWLLEMVVRPSPLARELAFALFLNLSVRATVVALARAAQSRQAKDAQSPQLQTWLFHVLVEMLSKSVAVASASSDGSKDRLRTSKRDPGRWIAHALGCVLLFVKQRSQYRADRLQALDPHVLQFFVRESSKTRHSDDTDLLDSSDATELTSRLLELLVVAMYAQESDVVFSDAASDSKSIAKFALPMAALEPFGGLDLLLAHYYDSTTALATQRLLFMVFFDVACHQHHRQQQQQRKPAVAAAEHELWHHVHAAELATFIAASPSRFTAAALARVAKKLYACASTALTHALSEKQVQQLFTQLRLVLHMDEYFSQSAALSHTLQVVRDQAKGDATDALMAKVMQLLGSKRIEDTFQVARWLAELVTFGAASAPSQDQSDALVLAQSQQATDDPLGESVIFTGDLDTPLASSAVTMQAHVDELEETCCFDESASIRLAARDRIWVLARSPSIAQRSAFVQTLSVFVKRKLSAQPIASSLTSLVREMNLFLTAVVQQRETSSRVLVPLLLLVLDVCKCDVSHRDRRKQQYDQTCTIREESEAGLCCALSGSDSLASRVVEGDVALDAALLEKVRPEFFEHVLLALEAQSHPQQSCRQQCCGSRASSPLLGDAIVCSALVVAHVHAAAPSQASVSKLAPLLTSCDSRVAIIAARAIVSALGRSDRERYRETLRELHARAVAEDAAALLTLSHMLANALLAHSASFNR